MYVSSPIICVNKHLQLELMTGLAALWVVSTVSFHNGTKKGV